MNQRRLNILLAGLVACAGVCRSAETGSQDPGEIRLGMSTALSGPAASMGEEMRTGVLAALDRANRGGGIHGRRLRLIALDDGYEPLRTVPNMRQLVETNEVLAVIGNVGTPTAIAAVPIATERKTLFYGAFTGASFLRREPPDRYVVNYRAGYAEEIAAMVDGLLDHAGLQVSDIAFLTQRDSYGEAGFRAGVEVLKRRGLIDEYTLLHVQYERNTLLVENALAMLLYADRVPRAIIMVGTHKPCAKFITLAYGAGLRPLFLNVSFVGSQPLAAELGDLPARVIVTQTVPHPDDARLPVVREYQDDLTKLDPSAPRGFGSLEGYIAGRIFTLALEQCSDPPSREGIVEALDGLGEFDIGLEEKLNLGPLRHQASHRVWPTILRNGGFAPFDWADLEGKLPGEALP